MTSNSNLHEMIKPYRLAPMQAGMLFQAQLAGTERGIGFDIEQIHLVLHERIERDLLASAWTRIARRHPALAAEFAWEQLDEPRQRVVADVVVPVEQEDWSRLSEHECQRRRAEFLARDRRRGFDLRVAPLMRVTLFACGAERSEIVWTFHHILLDGRSFAVVLSEVFSVYEALKSGRELALPAAPPPYARYIDWLAGHDAEAGRAFFRALLADLRAPTPLPSAESVARVRARAGHGELVRVIEPALLARLTELAERTGTSLGTIAHAAWALVLARFTRELTVLFGSTRSSRRDALDGQAEAMVGLFINTLPVCVRFERVHSVGELLALVREQWAAARHHAHLPLTDIHGQSAIPRGVPLFESLVMFESRELNATLRRAPGWEQRWCTLHEQPLLPLNVIFRSGDQLTLRLLFERRRFRDESVERLADALLHVLRELGRGEQRALREITVIAPAELHQLVVRWNDTARDFPEQQLLHEGFEQRAAQQPHAVALELEGRTLTYGELEARANRLAHALRARGARPGTFIAVCLPRGFQLVTALLAVSKAGAAYLPLDPRYPPERLALMLRDGSAQLAITDQAHRHLLACELLLLDDAELAAHPEHAPARTAAATDLCYAIFTSGSTGRPNGVMLSHRAVVNTLDWVNRTFGVGPADRLLFVTSPCFDLSVYDVFGVLGAGGTVVIASERELADPALLHQTLRGARITLWDSAPAALQRLVPFFGASAPASTLRLVLLSGDWIALSLPPALRAEFPSASVVSLGGATEAAIWSNWYPIGELDPAWTSVPYGRPIQNARYHVLDEAMQPVPIGVSGDLYIGGTCLAEGYLNQPALTAARFVPDPLRPGSGERLYKTGDLARYFEDGNLEFLGRADTQIKIRGFRVELGEVEAALAELAGVRAAVCAAHRDASGQNALIAYVVPAGAPLDESAIKRALAVKLPDFLVPSQVLFLQDLPLSSNGKVDRKSLPPPGEREQSRAFVAPRSARERQLAKLWATLLNTKSVGVTDDFFALGGHSLLALAMVSRAKSALGLELTVPDLLAQPTVEGVLRAVDARAAEQTGSRLVRTFHAAGARTPIVLLAGGAYALLYREFSRMFGPDQPVYLLQLRGAPDLHRLEQEAALYERELLAVCPEGPVVVGGFVSGAWLAFELAHRLRSGGRHVPLLVFVDGSAPRARSHAAGEPALRSFAARLASTGRRLRAIVERTYRPRPIDRCELLLVRAESAATDSGDPTGGWGELFGGSVTVLNVPGDHMAFLGDGSRDQVIAAIRERVQRALAT